MHFLLGCEHSVFLTQKQTHWGFTGHSQACISVKFPHCLWWSCEQITVSMSINFTCPPLQVPVVPAPNPITERASHLATLCNIPHVASLTRVFVLRECVAHPFLFQQFQTQGVSFPSLFQFSLFIGKPFLLFSRLWLLANGLISSAGKFEQFSVFTSVPSQGHPVLDCLLDASNYLLFGWVPILNNTIATICPEVIINTSLSCMMTEAS